MRRFISYLNDSDFISYFIEGVCILTSFRVHTCHFFCFFNHLPWKSLPSFVNCIYCEIYKAKDYSITLLAKHVTILVFCLYIPLHYSQFLKLGLDQPCYVLASNWPEPLDLWHYRVSRLFLPFFHFETRPDLTGFKI